MNEDSTFVAPAAWTFVPAPDKPNVVGIWRAPNATDGNFYETIQVLRYPGTESAHDYASASLTGFAKSTPSLDVVHREKNSDCPSGTSEVAELRATLPVGDDGADVPVIMIDVFTKGENCMFIASYTRLASSPADPEAVRAVKNTCATKFRF